MYSTLCADLASQGFVVIALEHEDGSGAFALALNDGADPSTPAPGCEAGGAREGEVVGYHWPPQGFVYAQPALAAFRRPFLEQRAHELHTLMAAAARMQHTAVASDGGASASPPAHSRAAAASAAGAEEAQGAAAAAEVVRMLLSPGGAAAPMAARTLAEATVGG